MDRAHRYDWILQRIAEQGRGPLVDPVSEGFVNLYARATEGNEHQGQSIAAARSRLSRDLSWLFQNGYIAWRDDQPGIQYRATADEYATGHYFVPPPRQPKLTNAQRLQRLEQAVASFLTGPQLDSDTSRAFYESVEPLLSDDIKAKLALQHEKAPN